MGKQSKRAAKAAVKKKAPVKRTKRDERKAAYDRAKLPKLTLKAKEALDLEKLGRQLKDLKGTRRNMLAARIHFEKKRRKAEIRRARNAAEARGEAVTRQTPDTIEALREEDETLVQPDDVDVIEADKADEFHDFFAGKVTPKLLLTTGKKPSKKMTLLLKELVVVLPNCFYYPRSDFEMKGIVEAAKKKEFTDILVLIEKQKVPYGLYVTHLPRGPTSFYRLTGLTLAQDIKGGAVLTSHSPELIMKNFDTRMGVRIGRQLQSLFPLKAEFPGRRVVVFQNQRDFVFFRQYRYIFADEGARARLQEIGPRFTLKLRFLQEGTFDASTGKFEFVWRPDMQVSRKRFFI